MIPVEESCPAGPVDQAVRRRFLRAAVMPFGALVLAGCGGGGGSDNNETAGPAPSPGSTPAPTTPPTPTPPVAPTPAPSPAPTPAPAPYGGPLTPAGPLPAWVSSLPLFHWYEIPNTSLASVAPDPVPLGVLGPKGKVEAWNGATLKRAGSVYLLGAAGGHRDYGGNEVNALALNVDLPRWVELCPPTPNALITANGMDAVQFYIDKKPSTTHTYHSTQFIDSLNRMIVFSSPGYTGAGGNWPPPTPWYYGDQLSFSFNASSSQWDQPEYVSAFPGTGDFTSALCVKHQVTNDVYYSKNYGDGIWRWNASSNSWTKLPNTSSRNPWFCGAAIDPHRSRMLIVGGYGPTPPEVRGLDGFTIAVSYKGLGREPLNECQHYDTCVYDEVVDCFWVLYRTKDSAGNGIGTRLLKVTAADWQVSDVTTTGMPPLPRVNGLHNSFQYVPELRGVVIMDSYTGNVRFMRTAA